MEKKITIQDPLLWWQENQLKKRKKLFQNGQAHAGPLRRFANKRSFTAQQAAAQNPLEHNPRAAAAVQTFDEQVTGARRGSCQQVATNNALTTRFKSMRRLRQSIIIYLQIPPPSPSHAHAQQLFWCKMWQTPPTRAKSFWRFFRRPGAYIISQRTQNKTEPRRPTGVRPLYFIRQKRRADRPGENKKPNRKKTRGRKKKKRGDEQEEEEEEAGG